jgi:hypothetical protein
MERERAAADALRGKDTELAAAAAAAVAAAAEADRRLRAALGAAEAEKNSAIDRVGIICASSSFEIAVYSSSVLMSPGSCCGARRTRSGRGGHGRSDGSSRA